MRRSLLLVLVATFLGNALGQSEGQVFVTRDTPGQTDWIMPRTEHGHPDLQGTWHFGSRTPLQRPPQLGLKQSYEAVEVSSLEASMQRRLAAQDAPMDPDRGAPEQGAVIRQEADDTFLAHWQEPKLVPVDGEFRTSVIINPADGRLPVREDFTDYHVRRQAAGLADTDGPEGQPLSGRCVMFGAAVPSLTPIMMNPNLLIVQNRDYVMIMTEMVHDARIIRLGGPHRNDNDEVRTWMGESVGYWEGDTLVVHTRNFRPEQSSARSMPLSEEFELVERYTLAADDAIRYEFTVTDPVAFTQPVTGLRTLTRNGPDGRVYEFACHEGNYSLPAILRGARVQAVEAQLAR